MIQGIIFDMDGLLVDSEITTYELYCEICEREGRALDKDFYYGLLGTNGAHIQHELGKYMGSEPLAIKIIAEMHDRLGDMFREGRVPTKKGALSLMEDLKEKGYKLAVATSSSRHRATEILELAGILPLLDGMACGDEVTNSKPHPEIFLKAAKAIGVRPEEAVVLEDSENGIIGAHAGGMHCINVPDLKQPSEVVISKADYIAVNLKVAGDHIFSLASKNDSLPCC